MAISPKIKHVDQLANGVLRFRRRFLKDVTEALGEGSLQVHFRNTSGLNFHMEYQAILQGFDRIVSETRDRIGGRDTRSPIERWHEAILKTEGITAETAGLEDDATFARHVIARGLAQRCDANPLFVKALVNPSAEAPKLMRPRLAQAAGSEASQPAKNRSKRVSGSSSNFPTW